MSHHPGVEGVDLDVLSEIERRVLWLAVRIVDAANRERETGDGVKVGGHQASSASLVSVMTALWFAHLDAADRVSVKPHASPVLHAINYLLGDLDRSYLTRLRARGGLQSYPSRTKDPDRVDFSTGSVGLGAAAPLFAAVTRRYVDAHFGTPAYDGAPAGDGTPAYDGAPAGDGASTASAGPGGAPCRFVALLGDAELDEGNIWEAIADPATQGLGNVLWIVDFNRQSLDRVVPGVRIEQWSRQFAAAGWHVATVKYGHKLRAAFERPGGEALRRWIDEIPNEQYQALFGLGPKETAELFLDGAPPEVHDFCAGWDAAALAETVVDLGGHDLPGLLKVFAECDAVTDRPSVVFAYTVKGWGLPIAGNPRNHAALLTADQIAELRAAAGLDTATEWDRLDATTPAGQWAAVRREHLALPPAPASLGVALPKETGVRARKPISTQESFGRILVDLSRDPEIAPYLVTTAPDVATSTNLAGFINRVGVFAPEDRRAWSKDPLLKWTEGPRGQHIELGISEMNLFLLLGQLGLAGEFSGQPLLPVGTVYDPFVLRGLDAFIYSVYSGSRFVIAGTPAGVTLAPEGGAHQSTITASVGLELPGVTFIEPAYAVALDWLLCDALGRIALGPVKAPAASAAAAEFEEDGAYYFRLTTRPLDQGPFEAARRRLGDAVLRRQVLAGAYRLVDATGVPDAQDATGAGGPGAPGRHGPEVCLVASGPVLPEVLAAAAELTDEGVAAHVVDVTSLDRLYTAWQRTLRQGIRTATTPSVPGALRAVLPDRVPVVTVHDAASHAMAWIGSALGVPAVSVGVDRFGQSGSVSELYELHDLDSGSIVNAALSAISLR
jgi:pyruvate dehydrogenase E1 component